MNKSMQTGHTIIRTIQMMEVMSYEKTTNCSSGMSRGRSHRICSGIFNTESRKRGAAHRNFTDFVYSRAYREKDTTETDTKRRLRDKNGQEESAAGQQENQQPTEKQLHFVPENVTNWPVKGDVLLPFSMDKTVYFPTLDQYQYNRGMVIRANEGDAVYSVTEGRIIDIYDSAETGCTVVQDLGDGYTATYGQLANLTCSEGDVLEAGETLGTVGKVTRYYTVEGTNVYFAMEQDGKPVNPMDYFGDI